MAALARLMWQPLPSAAGLPASLSRGVSTQEGGEAPHMPTRSPVLAHLDSDAQRSNAGDRVLLPSDLLERCLSASDGSFPMTFELRAYNGTRTFVGVQEFTSPVDVLTLPKSVLEALNLRGEDALRDDKRVAVRYMSLPKAQSIKLSPLTSDFLDIVDTRAFLESALRNNFTVLMNGQILTLRHEGFNYQLLVTDLQPSDAPAASIVNTDCNVDIGAPMDGGMSRRRATATLKLGEAVAGSVARGEMVYYSLSVPREIDQAVYGVYVEVARAASAGALATPASASAPPADPDADADVYISRGAVRKPSLFHHSWAITIPGGGRAYLVEAARDDTAHTLGASELVSAPPRAAAAATVTPETVADLLARTAADGGATESLTRTFYIGVQSSGGRVPFVLKADIVEKAAVPMPLPVVSVLTVGAKAKASDAAPVAAPPTGAVVVSPGMKACPSCGAVVPETNFVMHAAMCARNTVKCPYPGCGAQLRRHPSAFVEHWHCPVCALVMHEHVGRKHVALAHTPFACECGTMLPLEALRLHVTLDCPARAVVCRFCGASTRAGAPPADAVDRHHGLTEHEAYCGSRTGVCAFDGCGARMRLKDVYTHFAMTHPGMPVQQAVVPVELPDTMPASAPSGFGDNDSVASSAFQSQLSSEFVPGFTDTRPRWACPACTYDNEGTSAFCHVCGTPRPALPDVAPLALGRASAFTDSRHGPISRPMLCANQTCSNPPSRVGDAAMLRLCPRCFRLFAQEYEDSDALADGMTTRYNAQLEVGCGEADCRNPYCASARAYGSVPTSAADVPSGHPVLARDVTTTGDLVQLMMAASGSDDQPGRYYVCVTSCQRPLIRALGTTSTAAPAAGGLTGSVASNATALLGAGAVALPAPTTAASASGAIALPASAESTAAAVVAAAAGRAASVDQARKSRIASAFFH